VTVRCPASPGPNDELVSDDVVQNWADTMAAVERPQAESAASNRPVAGSADGPATNPSWV